MLNARRRLGRSTRPLVNENDAFNAIRLPNILSNSRSGGSGTLSVSRHKDVVSTGYFESKVDETTKSTVGSNILGSFLQTDIIVSICQGTMVNITVETDYHVDEA